jgi:hypothetical protein
MQRPNLKRVSGVFVIAVVLALSTEGWPEEPTPPGNGSRPVTASRLTGARLEHHRSDPALVWSFGETRFVLTISGQPVPRKLIETLTGSRTVANRIVGAWELDAEAGVLVLSTVRSDEKAVQRTARLPISAAGLVRVDLGDYQYDVFPGQADLGVPPRKLLFTQDGEDLLITMTIEIPDAPHALWTHAELVMDHDPYLEGPRRDPRLDSVELSYDVIQCRDDPILMHMRHRKKKVKVVWRLKGHRKVDVKYRVVKQFKPSAAELSDSLSAVP